MMTINTLEAEARIREFASKVGAGNCTVVVIPHDINAQTLVMVNDQVSCQPFNGLNLREVIRDAEQRRLEGAYIKLMEQLGAHLRSALNLPEERAAGAGN